jgi:hypothetical protein
MEDDEALLAPVEDSDEIFEIEDNQDCGFKSSSDLPSNFYQVSNLNNPSNFPKLRTKLTESRHCVVC